MSGDAPDILLVEDDEAIRASLVECLELEGRAVRAEADGVEALAWLRAGNRPRVVVLDLVMPRMGGEELLSALRGSAETRDLPVVLMTGASAGEGRLPEADRVLQKPFDLSQFLEALEEWL